MGVSPAAAKVLSFGLDERRRDWVFGIAAPIFVLAVDPFVFGGIWGRGAFTIFGGWRAFAFTLSAAGLAALAAFLVGRDVEPDIAAVVVGPLGAGAAFCFGVGTILLPFSLIGIALVGIGLLGFIPFWTGAVYLRNAREAFRMAEGRLGRRRAAVAALYGAAFFIAFPAAVQFGGEAYVHHICAEIVEDRIDPVEAGGRLRIAAWAGALDEVGRAYLAEEDEVRRARLAEAYLAATCRPIEGLTRRLCD